MDESGKSDLPENTKAPVDLGYVKVTSEYVSGVKEKTALKEEIAEVTKQLTKANSKNYDLSKKITKLEQEVSK